jgi:hypothetical protein
MCFQSVGMQRRVYRKNTRTCRTTLKEHTSKKYSYYTDKAKKVTNKLKVMLQLADMQTTTTLKLFFHQLCSSSDRNRDKNERNRILNQIIMCQKKHDKIREINVSFLSWLVRLSNQHRLSKNFAPN